MAGMSSVSDKLSQLHLTEKSCISLEKVSDDYVIHATAQSCAQYGSSARLAASADNNNVRLFSRETLAYISTIEGHEKPLTGLKFNKNVLYSSSMDGTVRSWDLRKSGESIHTFEGYDESQKFRSFDISCDGRIICAGTEQNDDNEVHLVFWDARMTEQLGVYTDCHQNDIEQVCFHPTKADCLLSGAMDGLVCMYDISEPSEDDAITSTVKLDSSVSRLGWCASDSNKFFSIAHTSAHIWDSIEFEPVFELKDIHEEEGITKNMDYIVDCFHNNDDEVFLLAGSNSGQIWIYRIEGEQLSLHLSPESGHSDVVRCLTWDSHTRTLVTGGEDSMLCLWKGQRPSQADHRDQRKSTPSYKSKSRAGHHKSRPSKSYR